MPKAVSARALELAAQRVPFVHARVVRAQAPASAHAGDEAIVHGDGTVEGFVGGVCAEGSVRTAALEALDGGGPLLLRILPEGETGFPETPGARVVVNPCLSGGALEIFLEPVLPPPLVEVVGRTPVADAVVAFAGLLGWDTSRTLPAGPLPERTAAVVVAGHGRDEEESIRAALAAGVGRVALVASHRRGDALLDGMGLDPQERARIHTPAGLDIGARTAPEVGLSILAELVEAVRSGETRVPVPAPGQAPMVVEDPVCGMKVTVLPDTPHLTAGAGEFWFCGPGCRDRYAAGLVG
ncbi:xanthine dehydrogenase accessory factor [Actinacidiphila yanglinensis]|uniref:Xanthine dehydrogenase accessory factor n=1 Tax=Actinacidiphila yanglinensis TaxID=310779 RepID=A0A1H6BRS6_9ACTN|nr:XdhC family protein [Actinacidiphila yanglinensis]SEG63383.1 xanthine dehydrogenase accessory factor [Actinacidiphila yanglinensis]